MTNSYTKALHHLKPWTRYGRECKRCDRRSLVESCDGCPRFERYQERTTGRGLLFALARTSTALLVVVLLSLSGCNGEGGDDGGASAAWWVRDCAAPQDAPALDEAVELTIRFRFVGSPTVKCGTVEAKGCAWTDGTIELAAQVDAAGRIVVPMALLGHEVFHQLEYAYPGLFPDPDTF